MRVILAALAVAAAAAWVVVWLLTYETARRSTRPPRLSGEGLGQVALALLLSSLQASVVFAWMPVGLWPVLLAVIAVTAAHGVVRHALSRQPISVTPAAILLVILALGAIHGEGSAYREKKILGLVLTLLVVVAASVLLDSSERRVRFLWAVVGVGVLALLLAWLAPADVALGRVATDGATTSATGRMAGGAVVVLASWAAVGRLRRPVLGVGASLLLVGLMFATGSRGPLVAAAVAVAVVLVLTFVRHPGRALAILVVGLAVARVGWGHVSVVAQDRIALLLADDKGASIGERRFMWSRTWDTAQSSFTGRGWGGLSDGTLVVDRYPHNLFLEVLGEAGWVAAGLLVLLILVAATRAARWRAIDPSALPMLALLVFVVSQSMVAGDLGDNRIVFVVAAGCWAMTGGPKRRKPLSLADGGLERAAVRAGRGSDVQRSADLVVVGSVVPKPEDVPLPGGRRQRRRTTRELDVGRHAGECPSARAVLDDVELVDGAGRAVRERQ